MLTSAKREWLLGKLMCFPVESDLFETDAIPGSLTRETCLKAATSSSSLTPPILLDTQATGYNPSSDNLPTCARECGKGGDG